MFLTYLLRELRRRMRQSVFIALGLALGVGLVITVTAAANGVSAGQRTVLKSLYGVGTDITVTKSPTAGSGGGPRFRFQGGRPGGGSTSVSHSILVGGGLGTLKSSAVTTVAGQKDVTAAVGALVLNDLKLSGTFTPGSGGAPGGGSRQLVIGGAGRQLVLRHRSGPGRRLAGPARLRHDHLRSRHHQRRGAAERRRGRLQLRQG